MSIRKIILYQGIVFIATAIQAAGQPAEPQTKGPGGPELALIADAAKQTEPIIPKRELKFDVSEEEESLPLLNVQEGMLDQRYVATFRFKLVEKEVPTTPFYSRRGVALIGGTRGGFPGGTRGGGPDGDRSGRRMITLGVARTEFDIFPGMNNRGVFSRINLADQLKQFRIVSDRFSHLQVYLMNRQNRYYRFDALISMLPADFRKEYQSAKEIDAKFLQINPLFKVQTIRDKDYEFVQVGLLAPTVEEAKQLTDGWLAYYDWALCYSAQLECLRMKKFCAQRLNDIKESLEKATSELSSLEKEKDKFNEFEDMKPESLAALITQRRMLSIDLVGINARIEACNQMLADKNATISRKDQVETAKATAEIELLGLEAKQKEINRIIQGSQDRAKYFAKISSLNARERESQTEISDMENAIQEIAIYQLGYQPLPVEDGKVTIRRIKWTSPPKEDEPKK
ncbi:MAG: hypothetical protein IT426_15295 [Pirellulales bacterium]|nr:hypothetical protein [Pirellulales bacterium]